VTVIRHPFPRGEPGFPARNSPPCFATTPLRFPPEPLVLSSVRVFFFRDSCQSPLPFVDSVFPYHLPRNGLCSMAMSFFFFFFSELTTGFSRIVPPFSFSALRIPVVDRSVVSAVASMTFLSLPPSCFFSLVFLLLAFRRVVLSLGFLFTWFRWETPMLRVFLMLISFFTRTHFPFPFPPGSPKAFYNAGPFWSKTFPVTKDFFFFS